jgi:predicted nucleotidyltransferase
MIQSQFAEKITAIVKNDTSVTGLAVAGSWLTNEIDDYSDLDLILVTTEKVSHDKNKMLAYAHQYGELLTAFTGEHVGEPRLLICLYNNPLLHVDIKFLTIAEFRTRIETPFLLFDRDGQLQKAIDETDAKFPYPDYQWIEDRFWTWVHYALLKIGRGEYFEALDFFGFLRYLVLGPLLHIKNNNLPRGVRKVETSLPGKDLEQLKSTLAEYNKESLLKALENAVALYRALRLELFDNNVKQHVNAETAVMDFFHQLKSKPLA